MKKTAIKIPIYYKCEICGQFKEVTFRPQKYCSEYCRRKAKYIRLGK